MDLVSVIIPARNERYLDKTILEVIKKAKGSVEVIAVLDGYDTYEMVPAKYVKHKEVVGMRTAINSGVAKARGNYIMKLDAHCMLDEGFDVKLIAEHQPNWVQIPRRKRLDAKTWTIVESKPDVDYMYLDSDLMGRVCRTKNVDPEFKKVLIDDTEAFQGSCYFMTHDYFNHLGLLDDKNFGGSGNESQEITFNVWHDGGRVVRNKKTWYAHARLGRLFSRDENQVDKSREQIVKLAEKYGYKTEKGIQKKAFGKAVL